MEELMKRMKVLVGNRRMMVLLTLAILVLAAAALVASSASFTAQSANPGNIFTSGKLALTTNPADSSKVTFSTGYDKLAPGHSVSGTVTVSNTGNVDGLFSLKGAVAAHTGDATFPDNLLLTVQENGVNLVTNQPLSTALSIAALQTSGGSAVWAGGATSTYKFTVTFKDNGEDGSGVGLDNKYMTTPSTVTYDLTWNAINN
jgi:hypothetical protein